jgi:hypothetical protein
VGGAIPTSGELNGVWLETGKGKVPRNLNTSQIVDPPDGKIPFSKEGKTRWDATPSLERELQGRINAADKPEDRPEAERCITTGGIFVPNPFYNNYHQIVQGPGYVVILTEMMHEHRVSPSRSPAARRCGCPLVARRLARLVGREDARRRDDELRRQTTFYGSTAALKFVERFTRADNDTINYQLTVTDPNTFSKPWTLQNSLWRSDEGIFEVGCHEGNYGLANILSGARAQEKK